MADLNNAGAGRVYAPGHEPQAEPVAETETVQENPVAEALIDGLTMIGPAMGMVLIIVLVVQRLRDMRVARNGDGLTDKRRAEIAEKQALRAQETREIVHNLRKERQQKTGIF